MGSKQERLSFRNGDEPPASRSGSGRERPVYSVSQVVRGANRLLEARFANIWIEGEVVGLKVGGSGHAYFNLKDDLATLPACMWRSAHERLRFALEDGQILRVFGRLGIFAKQGRFQLYVDQAEPAGLGALMLELEQRKNKLQAEGLFDPDRKRPLPRWPRAIGVVTSAHGAAIHDILRVAHRRCPSRIVLSPAVVQGPEAPHSIRRALARICDLPDIDVVIVGRGGGSMEDLWAFNDEQLARAVAACPVPVVSAVGHEVDVTICDLVADVRAATPSQAAEIVVPDREAIEHRLETLDHRLARAIERSVLDERGRLDQLQARLATRGRAMVQRPRARLRGLEQQLAGHHPRTRLGLDRRRLAALEDRLHAHGRALPRRARARFEQSQARLLRQGPALSRSARAQLDALWAQLQRRGRELPRLARLRLARAAGALQALSPLAVLERGYAVVTDEHGRAVTDAEQVRPAETIEVRLHRGRLQAEVLAIEPASATPRGEGDDEGTA